tara:strand:- start:714 stop:6380 length:5667 start_codon:yes stop_codon:yes gene_type:complete
MTSMASMVVDIDIKDLKNINNYRLQTTRGDGDCLYHAFNNAMMLRLQDLEFIEGNNTKRPAQYTLRPFAEAYRVDSDKGPVLINNSNISFTFNKINNGGKLRKWLFKNMDTIQEGIVIIYEDDEKKPQTASSLTDLTECVRCGDANCPGKDNEDDCPIYPNTRDEFLQMTKNSAQEAATRLDSEYIQPGGAKNMYNRIKAGIGAGKIRIENWGTSDELSILSLVFNIESVTYSKLGENQRWFFPPNDDRWIRKHTANNLLYFYNDNLTHWQNMTYVGEGKGNAQNGVKYSAKYKTTLQSDNSSDRAMNDIIGTVFKKEMNDAGFGDFVKQLKYKHTPKDFLIMYSTTETDKFIATLLQHYENSKLVPEQESNSSSSSSGEEDDSEGDGEGATLNSTKNKAASSTSNVNAKSNDITVNIRPIELLYIFCDNLHDFEDEGSLTKESAKGIGLIALMVLKTYGNIENIEGDEIVIIEFIKEILNRTNGPIRENTSDGDTFEGLITKAKYPPGNRFIDMIVNKEKYRDIIPEMKGFLTADYGAQRLLYRKIFEDHKRFFVKNPSSIIVNNDDGHEEQIEVEVVSPENYRFAEDMLEHVDEISFMADGNWNTLLNSNTLRYDGTTIEGQIHFLEYQGEKDAYTIANSTKAIRDLLMEYKEQPDFPHLIIDKFTSQYVGNVSKNYWFLPDAVLKASTTYSANFQDMSKYIKMGYGSSPIYQTIVGVPNHYDMASGTIVKAITPQVQQIQETPFGVGTTLNKRVEVRIENKLTYTLEPLKTDTFNQFSEAVMIIYGELLKWVNNKFRVQKIDAAHYQQFFADANLIEFFQDFGKGLDGKQNELLNNIEDMLIEQYAEREEEIKEAKRKQFVHEELNKWGDSKKRQIDEIGGGDTIDILKYQPPSSKQSISLVYQIKEFAANTHADTNPEFYQEKNHVILTGKNWKQDPHFPNVSKTTGDNIIGKQKYSNSFFKFKKIPTIVADNEFKNYLIYLFLCDYTEIYNKEGVPEKSRDKIPTIKKSQIYHKWLVPYFSLSDPQDPKGIPVSQKIETTGIEDFGHTKVNSRIGPSVVQLEKRWRKLLLSLFLTFGGNKDGTKKKVADYIKWLEEKNKKRGEDGPKGNIQKFQNEMLSYLFAKPSFADTDIDKGTPGEEGVIEYRSEEHEFIAKSWETWTTSEEGRKNDFVSFFGKILYLPIQSKLNSDWTQTLFTSYLNIHKSNYERGGYSRTTDGTHTLKKHNIFFPTSYDVFCTLGALISGTIMAENAGNRGVLMGTNFDPRIYDIINNDDAMKWMESLGLDKKLEKFKMTMINFCSGIFEDYYDAYTKIMKNPVNLDANESFILDFHNKISQKWSDGGYNWTVNLTLIFKLKKALFALDEKDTDAFRGTYKMTYTEMLSFIEQIERDIEYNKTIPSIQEENKDIKLTIELMNKLIKMRQQLRNSIKYLKFIPEGQQKMVKAQNAVYDRDITYIDNLLKNLQRVLKRQKIFHLSYGHLKTAVSGLQLADIKKTEWDRVANYLFLRSGQKGSFHMLRTNFPTTEEWDGDSIEVYQDEKNVTVSKDTTLSLEHLSREGEEQYNFSSPGDKTNEEFEIFKNLSREEYKKLVQNSLNNGELKPILQELRENRQIAEMPTDLTEAQDKLNNLMSKQYNLGDAKEDPKSPGQVLADSPNPNQVKIRRRLKESTKRVVGKTRIEMIKDVLKEGASQISRLFTRRDNRQVMPKIVGEAITKGLMKTVEQAAERNLNSKKLYTPTAKKQKTKPPDNVGLEEVEKEINNYNLPNAEQLNAKTHGLEKETPKRPRKSSFIPSSPESSHSESDQFQHDKGPFSVGSRRGDEKGKKKEKKKKKKGGNNTTQKIKRKKGRKSQNKRKKPKKGSKKRRKKPHRNTRKIALKIEH